MAVIVKLYDWLLTYVMIPVLTWGVALVQLALMNTSPSQFPEKIFWIAMLPLVLVATAYESGYKKFFLVGHRIYFFAAFVVPTVIATLSFLFAVYKVYGAG